VLLQVKRLQSHPSIALWGGNNENEGALTWFNESLANPNLYVADYVKLYVDTIYTKVHALDPSRPWVDSSPSNQEIVIDPYVKRWGNCQDQVRSFICKESNNHYRRNLMHH